MWLPAIAMVIGAAVSVFVLVRAALWIVRWAKRYREHAAEFTAWEYFQITVGDGLDAFSRSGSFGSASESGHDADHPGDDASDGGGSDGGGSGGGD